MGPEVFRTDLAQRNRTYILR